MNRTISGLLLLLAVVIPARAQQTQTKVTGTIVDPNSVPYYPATVLACLTPPTQNPTVAGAAISTNPGVPYCVGPAQTGPDGTFQIPLYANSVIQCNNVTCSTQWQFTVTAVGTAPPAGKGAQNFQVNITITSLTAQDVSATLNLNAPTLLNSGGGGSSIGPGTPTNVSCFSSTTNVQNCLDQITDTGGVVNIPADLVVGRGGGAASVAYPAGDPATCQSPTAGLNFICSDGTANTMSESDNGGAYSPTAKVTGAITAGDCASFLDNTHVQDAGVGGCQNLPSSAGPHTFLGNNTESSQPLQATIPIGTNDFGPNIFCVTSGSADAYVATLPVPVTALTAGIMLTINPNFTNSTSTPTLAANGLTAKLIMKSFGSQLVNVVPGDIPSGVPLDVRYDGTEFVIIGAAGTARSMWPCAPHFSTTDTIDFSTNPTETLFAYSCKIPANTLISGVVIHGFIGANITGTGAGNATFKGYLCPTQGSLTGCKNLYTSTSSPLSSGSFAVSMPLLIQGTSAASSSAAVEQAVSGGGGANTPFGKNSILSSLAGVPTNGDLYIQFTLTFQAGTLTGNSMTLTSEQFF
jgi:hypothetical protein